MKISPCRRTSTAEIMPASVKPVRRRCVRSVGWQSAGRFGLRDLAADRDVPCTSDPAEMVTGETFGVNGKTDGRVRSVAVAVPTSVVVTSRIPTSPLLDNGNSPFNRMLKL